jgi:hypothetical protein
MTDVAKEIATAFAVGPFFQGYIRGKLRTDPVFDEGLRALRECDGKIVDLGCGFGLFGLWAGKHGLENPYSGYDLSSWKIEAGRRAARALGFQNYSLEVENMTASDLEGAGLIVAFDVIHYLDSRQQNELFDRLARAAQRGSIVLIRTGVRGCGWRTSVTIAHEWWTRLSGWIRGGHLNFPTREGLVAAFEARDCDVIHRPLWGGTPFSSHLFKIRR